MVYKYFYKKIIYFDIVKLNYNRNNFKKIEKNIFILIYILRKMNNTYYTQTAQYENLKGNTTVTYYSRNEQDSKAMIRVKKVHEANATRKTTQFVNSFFN